MSGSKLRDKLLGLLFSNPESAYYVRQLADLIGEDPGNVSRELRRLEADGLVTSQTTANAKFFQVNKQYPAYKEMRAMALKTFGVEGVLRRLLDSLPEIESAFVYGSFVMGKTHAGSDIDLVIVTETLPEGFVSQIKRAETRLGREINYTCYSRDEYEKERGEGGGFLNEVLNNRVLWLKGAGGGGKD